MQLPIERPYFFNKVIVHVQHFLCRHAVFGNLVCKEVGEPQRLYRSVPKVAQALQSWL